MLDVIMESLSVWILGLMLILVQSAILVQGTCNGFGKSANFIISFLEDIPDEDLGNITLAVKQASSQVSCSLSCLNKKGCVTSLLIIEQGKCLMLSRFLSTKEDYKISQVQKPTSKIIVLKLADPCSRNPCDKGTKCVASESGFMCVQAILEGKSCQDIRQKFPSLYLKNGEYRITNAIDRLLFKAYCDMNFDKGGWTQVAKIRHKGFKEVSTFTDYLTTDNFLVTSQFLAEFKKVADFKEFRFECKQKEPGRKIHIKTKISKKAVFDFLVGKSDVQPRACGSFTPYEDDNSELSKKCAEWGNYGKGKWGKGPGERLADHTLYVVKNYYWILRPNPNPGQEQFDCDDRFGTSSSQDFWNIYVR